MFFGLAILAGMAQPANSVAGLPPTAACDAMRQAVRDNFAIQNIRFGGSPHPTSPSVPDYLSLSDRLAEVMNAPVPTWR